MAFPVQGKDVKHKIVIYRYMGVDHPQNGVRHLLSIDGQHIHSLTQVRSRYLAVSLDKELRIYDIPTGQHLHSMKTDQPFQLLAQVTPKGHRYDFDLVAEAFVGYSYKNYFECGIALDKGPLLQDFQFKSILDQAEKRKRKIFPNSIRPQAITTACQCTLGGVNYLFVAPREEEDTLIVFKMSIKA